MNDIDYVELVTVTLALMVCIVTGFLSLRAGYRKGQQEAAGEIRQFIQVKVSEIRTNRRELAARDERHAQE